MNGKGGKAGHSLQLAFSLREKALALGRECEEAHRAGRIGEPEYRSLREFYVRHAHRAEERAARLKQEHRRRADAIRRQVQDVARKQAELHEMVAAREIRGSRANRLNRRYQELITNLTARYREENRLASAASALEVGGFVDLPLERYATARTAAPATSLTVGRLAATAAAVLGSMAVFLPWLSLEGDAHSLAALPAALGVQETLTLPLIALLVIYIVLPLVGAVFAWMESLRPSGRGMVVAGAAVVALGALAVVGAAVAGSGSYFASEILMALRWGAFLYLAAGTAILMLGLRRGRAAEEPEVKGGGRRWLLGMAVAAVAVVGAIVFIATRTGHAKPEFSFSRPSAGAGAVSIAANNTGTADADLYVPWPEGRADSPLVENRRNAFGFLLYIREQGSPEFRLYPGSQECWSLNGRPIPAGAPMTVAPQLPIKLSLDPEAARRDGLSPEAVRVVATDAAGNPLATYQQDLSPTLR